MRRAFLVALGLLAAATACGRERSPRFSRTYAEEAIWQLPRVRPNHPRIFLRDEPWAHGPSLRELRQWARLEPWRSWLRQRPTGPEARAFKYLLTGDESLVAPIVAEMRRQKYWPGTLAWVATCYDWIFNSPSFGEEDKREVEELMCRMAEQAIKMGERYGDMWSHYGYEPLTDIIMAGLVLYGRRPEARRYLALGGGYLKRNFLPGWQRTGGAWQGGWTYYRYSVWPLVQAIAAWSSATDEDLFQAIKERYGNWLEDHLYYLIYTLYPDGTPVESCGFSYCPKRFKVPYSLLVIACAYANPDGIRYLRERWGDLRQWWWCHWPYLFYRLPLRRMKLGPCRMPLARLWGREGVGYVQMRSGWGEGDTVVEFNCGDYFWSHTFLDQNAFTIYRKGRLAIQSGVYADPRGYFGPFMTNYYRRSISSNTVLVYDPKEVGWRPGGWFREPGGQREVYLPDWGPETCFTFREYLWRLNHANHFETGDITAFEVGKDYVYVCGDATAAYNNPRYCYPRNRPKLRLFTRQLAFLDGRCLVVFDRVESTRPEFQKAWLIHCIDEPEVEGKVVRVESPGHRLAYEGDVFVIAHGGGKLYGQVLLPRRRLIWKIGGGATVTEARPDPRNRGNARLEVHIRGEYRKFSRTIAYEGARVEDWTVEFIDDHHYQVVGSKTGPDGVCKFPQKEGTCFVSNSCALLIPASCWSGTPRKGDRFYFSVTSPSSRFWANGRNWCPGRPPRWSHIVPGSWRLEVRPARPRRFDMFLHVLWPCDRDDACPSLARLLDLQGCVGVALDGWVVLFGREREGVEGFRLQLGRRGNCRLLIVDLPRRRACRVEINGQEQTLRASKEGTLCLSLRGPCTVRLEVQKGQS